MSRVVFIRAAIGCLFVLQLLRAAVGETRAVNPDHTAVWDSPPATPASGQNPETVVGHLGHAEWFCSR